MSQKIRVSPNVRVVRLDKESILLNVETGKIHALNATAGYIWKLIEKDGPLTMTEIRKRLKDHYEASEKELDRGVKDLIGDLQKRRLIEKIAR